MREEQVKSVSSEDSFSRLIALSMLFCSFYLRHCELVRRQWAEGQVKQSVISEDRHKTMIALSMLTVSNIQIDTSYFAHCSAIRDE